MRWFRMLPAIMAGVFVPGCGAIKTGELETAASPFGPTGIPPQLRGGDQGGTAIKAGGNVSVPAPTYNPDELVWTDPDNPDASIPQLQNLMAAGPQEGPWRESETKALRESKNSGKPLLIWFTDSVRSTACGSLSAGLLTKPEFESWATENTVRLIVDQSVKGKDMDEDARKKLYVRGLKEKYNARGYPTLLVVSPSGEVIGRYKGYRKGQEDFVWGQLKQGVQLAGESHRTWKAGLEKKGYREWSDGKGRVIFARLAAYKGGDLVLAEPDGQKARTQEKNLSAGDRVWIQQQKEQRGIR